jgi:hypothetical protein
MGDLRKARLWVDKVEITQEKHKFAFSKSAANFGKSEEKTPR